MIVVFSMRDIKHLPEAVRSSVRSGIVLFNLTRIVEELIFNSLDARATKVSVAVGVGTHYIKVVDNGCGITWDGLVLLGERYATSKVDQLANINAISGSFGYRGEALSSISDVSLLEVITKAHGRPNGYREVMKGCKCLYLGIDDGRQDVGTTGSFCISFDLLSKNSLGSLQSLFGIYFTTNQFGGSISNLVKKCVLRIAIVHPKVFFEVVDIESEDELFCTTPSSSPLSLLTSGFGIEIFSSLHELNVSDGVLKLSGYMSSPRDTSFVKACQFVCIREVDYLVSVQRVANMKLQNGKRRNSSSRGTVMSEEDNTWREGDDVSSPEKDLPEKYEIAKRRCRMYNHRASFGLLSPQLEMPTEESDHMFHWKDNRFSCQDASEHQIRLGSLYQTNYSFQLCDGLLAPSRVTVNQKSASYLQATDHNVFSSEDHFLGNKFFGEKRSSEHTDYILGSRLEDAHFNVDASINDVDKISEDLKPFLHNCSCRRSLPVDGASPASSEGFDFRINGFGAKRKSLEPNDWVCVGEIDDNNQRFDFLPGTLWQDEAASAWSSPGPMSKCDVLTGLDFLSRDSIESSAIGGECLAGENDLPPDSIARVGEFFSSRQSLKSEWSSVMSDPLFRTKSQNVDNFFDENALERRIKYDNRYDYLAERVVKDRGFYFDDSLRKSSSQEDFSTSFANMCSEWLCLDSHETSGLKHPQQSSSECQLYSEPNSVEDPLIYTRYCTLKESHDPLDSGLKWQKSCLRTARGDKLHNLHNESNILDVSSGILHLAGDSLVPESINKNCLEDAKVLQQVDKKFIPIVGGGVLAIIDQVTLQMKGSAWKNYVRRQNAFVVQTFENDKSSVANRLVKFIGAIWRNEDSHVLPEIGYQLLHNYADQIQNWGWLCNIRSLGSRNLNLLHRQPTVVTLNAVLCIVGVNLTDVDLLEFLQQLADTDGSSTIPPSVHRVLNSKACRGAIMFGDTLLPSECSLIVEELKQTSLCFQCAHGRPTTVPLVNLEALHKQIAKLGLWNGGSNELWHGLHQHEPSLERAAQRLSSARGLS
ncbi:unnamed protein product [Camellia sinensis]